MHINLKCWKDFINGCRRPHLWTYTAFWRPKYKSPDATCYVIVLQKVKMVIWRQSMQLENCSCGAVLMWYLYEYCATTPSDEMTIIHAVIACIIVSYPIHKWCVMCHHSSSRYISVFTPSPLPEKDHFSCRVHEELKRKKIAVCGCIFSFLCKDLWGPRQLVLVLEQRTSLIHWIMSFHLKAKRKRYWVVSNWT